MFPRSGSESHLKGSSPVLCLNREWAALVVLETVQQTMV